MTVASQPHTVNETEYFSLELGSETRHEYRGGAIIPMTGGTPEHNQIAGALYVLLWTELRSEPFAVFVTDQRLWIPQGNIYTYPDVMVTGRPLQRREGRRDTVANPIVLAEVLSESTEAYDRGDKFEAYRSIPTFQEYLLIDQRRPRVEQFIRQSDRQWLLTAHEGKATDLSLSSLPVTLRLGDLYEQVERE